MTDKQLKALEVALRRKAKRQGLILQKSRVRTLEAPSHGTYRLIDASRNSIELGDPSNGYGMSLVDIEDYLKEERWPVECDAESQQLASSVGHDHWSARGLAVDLAAARP